MDPAPESLPDDVAALKAALIAERARRLEVAAELVVAQAKASEDMALIAAQKLRIAKLERQVFGQRSERSARLIDQLALEFEELEATATEDELAAEQAAAKTAKKDAEPKIKVGDELINVPQLDACPDNTILGDNAVDAWQKIEGRWYCTQPEMNNDGYASYDAIRYAPLTVLYLEDDE